MVYNKAKYMPIILSTVTSAVFDHAKYISQIGYNQNIQLARVMKINKLFVTLNIRPGEENTVWLLFLFSFLLGLIVVFLVTMTDALFLSRFGVENLPYVYIGQAIMVIIVGFIYSRLEKYFTFVNLLTITLGLLALWLTVLWYFLNHFPSHWPVLLLMLWVEAIAILVELIFWGLAGRLLDVRQGKRLFALISAGEVMATIIGGFLIRGLIPLIGTTHLIIVPIGALLGCLLLVIHINRTSVKPLALPEEKTSLEETKVPFRPWRSPYLVLLSSLVVLSWFGDYFVDYLFYHFVEIHYLDEDAIASFLGPFFAIVGIINLFFRTFISGRLISHYGITLGLFLLPLTLLMCSIIIIIIGLFGNITNLVFVVIATKLFDVVLRVSLETPSIIILYQPLPIEQRMSAQTFIESVVGPFAMILVGATLVLLTSYWKWNTLFLYVLLLFILIIWLNLIVPLGRKYTDSLARALSKRVLTGETLEFTDASSLAILHQRLNSPLVNEVIYCLDLLEKTEHKFLGNTLKKLLKHPKPEVRQDVLQRIERLNLTAAENQIKELLTKEQLPQVQGTALRTLASLEQSEHFEQIIPYLNASEREVRKGALVGLLQNGVSIATERLFALISSTEAEERKLAAEVLGEVGVSHFEPHLLKLIQDENLEVQKTALFAAGKLGNPKLWQHLIKTLEISPFRHVSTNALIIAGEAVVPELENAFNQQSRSIQVRIAFICGRIGRQSARKSVDRQPSIEFLYSRLGFTEPSVRHQLLEALTYCQYVATHKETQEKILGTLYLEADEAKWVLTCLLKLDKISKHFNNKSLLFQALKAELSQIRKRIFLLLGMLYSPMTMKRVKENYYSEISDKRAYAREVLDNMISWELKNLILPLLDDNLTAQRLNVAFFNPHIDCNNTLNDIIANKYQQISFWTRTCALYEVGITKNKACYSAVIKALSAKEPVVRETAVWTLGQLDPPDLGMTLAPLTHDQHANVAAMANLIINIQKNFLITRSPHVMSQLHCH